MILYTPITLQCNSCILFLHISMKEPAINLPADPGIRSCIPDLFSGELVRIPVGCSTAFGDSEMQQQGCQPP